MKRLTSCFTAAAQIAAFATLSAQNAVAEYKAGASSAAEASQHDSRSNGTVRAPHAASAAQGGRAVDNRNDPGVGAPSGQGALRGGPENPSGLRKPD